MSKENNTMGSINLSGDRQRVVGVLDELMTTVYGVY